MDAVTVQVVEREVAGKRNGDEQPEAHAPRQPHLAHGREKPVRRDEPDRQREEADNGVRMAAMVQQVADRRRSDPGIREIEVRQIRGNDAGADKQRTLRVRGAAAHGEIGKRDAD